MLFPRDKIVKIEQTKDFFNVKENLKDEFEESYEENSDDSGVEDEKNFEGNSDSDDDSDDDSVEKQENAVSRRQCLKKYQCLKKLKDIESAVVGDESKKSGHDYYTEFRDLRAN